MINADSLTTFRPTDPRKRLDYWRVMFPITWWKRLRPDKVWYVGYENETPSEIMKVLSIEKNVIHIQCGKKYLTLISDLSNVATDEGCE